jgi:hypothetical protein
MWSIEYYYTIQYYDIVPLSNKVSFIYYKFALFFRLSE